MNRGKLVETRRFYNAAELIAAIQELSKPEYTYMSDRNGDQVNFLELRELKLTDGSTVHELVIR